jgi:hypothetical protein
VKRFETLSQYSVDTILYGVAVSEIGDPDFGARLSDALDAAFTLLKPGGIPGKVDIDERAEALKVQALRGGVVHRENLKKDLPVALRVTRRGHEHAENGRPDEDERLAAPPFTQPGARLPVVRFPLLVGLGGKAADGELGFDEGGPWAKRGVMN